ncbi:MAG: glycosyltransferase family 4 protein [Anaerolineales bacterium]
MRPALDARTVNNHYPGIGRYTFELARALTGLTNLTLLVNPLQVSQEFDVWSLRARRIAVPYPPRSLPQQWVVPARLRRAQVDVYHSPYYLMPYAPGLPAVVTAHDLIPLYIGDLSSAHKAMLVAAHRLAFHAARKIIAVSEWTRADFIEKFHLPPDKVVAIPHGVAPEFRPPAPEALAGFRRQWELPRDYLLTVGINKPHKNLPRLIQAYAALPAGAPPLVVAGPEDARYPEVRAAASGLGRRVMFIGRVAEAQLPLLYAGATLFVQPSLMEGFGLPVVEAMACGTPVACADAPGLTEAAGGAARLFNPHEIESIVHALVNALGDSALRAGLRARGLRRARELTWTRTAEATLKVYHEALA